MGPRRATLSQRMAPGCGDRLQFPTSPLPATIPAPSICPHCANIILGPPPRLLHKTGPCRAGDTVSLHLH